MNEIAGDLDSAPFEGVIVEGLSTSLIAGRQNWVFRDGEGASRVASWMLESLRMQAFPVFAQTGNIEGFCQYAFRIVSAGQNLGHTSFLAAIVAYVAMGDSSSARLVLEQHARLWAERESPVTGRKLAPPPELSVAQRFLEERGTWRLEANGTREYSLWTDHLVNETGKIQDLVEEYRLLSEEWDRALPNAKIANRIFDQLRQLGSTLGRDPRGRAGLEDLLVNDNRAVRMKAAAQCLAWAPERAIAALESLISPRGTHSLSAEMTLREFKTGRIGRQ